MKLIERGAIGSGVIAKTAVRLIKVNFRFTG